MILTGETEVTFGEFSRACDLVEDYFGETLDDVALDAPVSKRQLIAVLARVQLSSHRLTVDELADAGELVFQSDREILYWLERDLWSELRREHNLAADEGRAARAVHRRIVEAIDGADECDREPFVRIEHPIRCD